MIVILKCIFKQLSRSVSGTVGVSGRSGVVLLFFFFSRSKARTTKQVFWQGVLPMAEAWPCFFFLVVGLVFVAVVRYGMWSLRLFVILSHLDLAHVGSSHVWSCTQSSSPSQSHRAVPGAPAQSWDESLLSPLPSRSTRSHSEAAVNYEPVLEVCGCTHAGFPGNCIVLAWISFNRRSKCRTVIKSNEDN